MASDSKANDVCPVCRMPGANHLIFEHQVARDVAAVAKGAPACGCDPDLFDQTGPCIRKRGHQGDCIGLFLRLCPACRHPWDAHDPGEVDLSAPGAARDPNAPRPWVCTAAADCSCGAWMPHDLAPMTATGERVLVRCRDESTTPHPPAS